MSSQLADNGATVSSSSEDLGEQRLTLSEQHHFLGKPGGVAWQVVWVSQGQAEGGPSCAKAWWQLPGEESNKDRARMKCPFAAMCLVMLSANSLTQLGGFCFALCVNLLVWLGMGSPVPVPWFPRRGRGVDIGLLLLWSAVETS